MKKQLLITVLIVALMFVTLPAFCKGSKEVATSEGVTVLTEEESEATESSSDSISDAVATVNLIKQSVITSEQLNKAVEAYKEYNISEEDILDSLIEDELMSQAMERDGYNEYIEYYSQAYIQQYRDYIASQVGDITDEQFEAICLQYNGYTSTEIGNSYAKNYVTQVYVQTMKEDLFNEAEMPTQDEIKYFYNQNLSSFVNPENVKLSHIFFDAGTDKAAALEKANNVSSLISSGKITFEDAVTSYSEDQDSKTKNGEIGYYSLGDTASISGMGDNFTNEVFKLNVGEVSGVIESNVGYHIVRIAEHNQSKVLGLDEKISDDEETTVSEYIENYLTEALYQQILSKAYTELSEELKSQASIKYLNK